MTHGFSIAIVVLQIFLKIDRGRIKQTQSLQRFAAVQKDGCVVGIDRLRFPVFFNGSWIIPLPKKLITNLQVLARILAGQNDKKKEKEKLSHKNQKGAPSKIEETP